MFETQKMWIMFVSVEAFLLEIFAWGSIFWSSWFKLFMQQRTVEEISNFTLKIISLMQRQCSLAEINYFLFKVHNLHKIYFILKSISFLFQIYIERITLLNAFNKYTSYIPLYNLLYLRSIASTYSAK